MRFFSGPRGTVLTVLAALLLPAIGVGVASALEVGDSMYLLVPDLAEFPEDPMEMQFTCRAVTEHAYWLVQDTVSVDKKGGATETDSLAWGVTFTQGELDTLTAQFEGGDVDVWNTVTGVMGEPVDTDGDPKVWIVLATIPTKYNSSPTSQSPRNNMAYVNPADLEGDFNGHDIIYLNIHTYATVGTTLPIAKELRKIYMPNGLAYLSRISRMPTEDQWIVRGLGEYMQFLCFGFTRTDPGNLGHHKILSEFRKAAYLDLANYQASNATFNWAASRGQSFLWFLYLAQREGESVIQDIAQSDTTSMLNVARAIEPSVPDSSAIQTNVVPIYRDWLVCNLVSPYESDMAGGIYTYQELSTENQFGFLGWAAAFTGKFSEPYPIDTWIADELLGMNSTIWSAQYSRFQGDYSGNPEFYFNGMYSDGGGSGSVINGRWEGFVVSLNTTDSTIVSIDELELNDLYIGDFTLQGDEGYFIVTNNNPGGVSGLRYVISQDTDIPDVLLSAHQNSVNEQYLTLYTTLFDSIPEGFDWYGPVFTASTADSSATVGMGSFYETLWQARFMAWEGGAYELEVMGYDSAGFTASNSITASVGWVEPTGLDLEIDGIRLDVPSGAAAPGTMVSLCEASLAGMAAEANAPIGALGGQMTGVLAGPVSMPDVNGTLSFPAEGPEGSVYRWSDGTWTKVDSWYQSGKMSAQVSEGGIYVLGEGPGVASPQLPAELAFGGTYPNPFSAQAAISFALPSAGRVNVTIYDMSGRVVTTLADNEMQAAEHTLVWDGNDSSGNPVGAGVYFCRLQAAGETFTQKMLRVE